MPNKTLQQQGIASAPFPAPVYPQLFMMPGSISKACSPSSALSSLQDLRTSKVLLRMRVHWRKSTLPFGKLLRYLPQTLQTLSFPTEFNQSLKRVTLPSSLQSLSFWEGFNQSLDHVIPCDLAKWLSRLEFWGAVDGERLSCNQGSKFVLHHLERRWKKLMPNKTLQQQGIASAPFSCTRIPTTVYDAWLYIQGLLPFQCTLIPARPWNFESLAEDESALTKINFAIWQTIALPSSNTSDLEFSYGIYPELEVCDPAKQPSIFKFWEEIQPKLGPCDTMWPCQVAFKAWVLRCSGLAIRVPSSSCITWKEGERSSRRTKLCNSKA